MGQNDEECRPSSSERAQQQFIENDPTYLEPFVHQVGGHGGVLVWDDRTVCKPYSTRERQYYEVLPCEFKSFVPEFRGVIEVGLIEDSSGYMTLTAYSPKAKRKKEEIEKPSKCCARRRSVKIKLKRSGSFEFQTDGREDVAFTDERCGSASPVASNQNPWAKQCQSKQFTKMQRKKDEKQHFLLLENLVTGFNYPCILDLKMGIRQFADDATEAKRKSQALKCESSTSSVLGVRLCGMQVYQTNSGVFKCHNKYYGRTLSVAGFQREMRQFWNNGVSFRVDLLAPCLTKLKDLRAIISQKEGFRFYSSSLLIIYDGDASSPIVDVRMIDFENCTCPGFRTDPAHDGVDAGYLKGLDSLIDILSNFNENQTYGDEEESVTSETESLLCDEAKILLDEVVGGVNDEMIQA